MANENITIDRATIDSDSRFSRFELISWWNQEKLGKSKILLIGAGALGNEILKNLALLGVGNVLVADFDKIENSNLSRSILYRESDNGAFKADVACRSAKEIYPDIKTHPFTGNVVHDLGCGVYQWADLIIAGLDNREARVSINANSLLAGKVWIDGAIEVLNGVARVFYPDEGACYECTMSETDWKMLEARRSCAMLSRNQMQEGKVPTTPTMASIIAGIQVQEAVKYLHGMETLKGQGFVFNGQNFDTYVVSYSRKKDCYAHNRYQQIEKLGCGVADITIGELFGRARAKLGADDVSIDLSRDILCRLDCPKCVSSEPVFSSLGKITEERGICPKCREMRIPEIMSTIQPNSKIDNMTFGEIGVPYFDIVTARNASESCSYLFDRDAAKILGPIA